MRHGARYTVSTIIMALCVTLIGCGTPPTVEKSASSNEANQVHSAKTTTASPRTFFQDIQTNRVELTLQPSPLVKKQMPDVPSPTAKVQVYLPVYPGATKTSANSSIGDLGTPMDADLVDKSVYYKSHDSMSKIQAWYSRQFKKLGYHSDGSGSSELHRKTVSTYTSFAKAGSPGSPTKSPDITLGFLTQQQNNMTIFKLKVSFIIVPPRPKDSYLPKNIDNVVLKQGKTSTTVMDKAWISKIGGWFNQLQMMTPGISGGPSVSNGTNEAVTASFYTPNGKSIDVKFDLPFWTVTVGSVKLKDNITLEKAIQAKLGHSS